MDGKANSVRQLTVESKKADTSLYQPLRLSIVD